jgi:hypothetical protein
MCAARRLNGSRALLRHPRFSFTVLVLACLLLLPLPYAQPGVASRVASASTTPLSGRGSQVHSDESLLAQAMPVGARADAEGILALFDASEPTTVEEQVARAHGLAIISRLTLEPLGKRVVRFRIPDARSTTELVAELSADSRVSSAQPNFRYQLPDQSRISGLRPRLNGRVDKAKRLAGRQHLDDGKSRTRPFAWQRRGSLVAGNQATVRRPTAGEPLVDLGIRNR